MARATVPLWMRGNKFSAKKVEYNGVTYDSKAEARRAQELDLLLRFNEIVSWKGQVKFQLCPALSYKADFVVETRPGKRHAEDVKGYSKFVQRWAIVRQHWAIANPMPLIILRSAGPTRWDRYTLSPKGREIPVTGGDIV